MLKKHFILALFSLFLINVNAQTTSIPDPNFEQALIDLNIDSDGTLNGTVSTADISGIISLDVSNKNISSLTGIEDFVALKNLQCYQNNLTVLNVTNNTALTDLGFSQNQITYINVTHNTLLTSLYLLQNKITYIDVSHNTKLTSLACNANRIETLDVSNNTLLEYLYCGDNFLTELDVSQNSALKSFHCENNKLVSLNVKNGNNSSITNFYASKNLTLRCIQVDNPDDANNGTTPYDTWIKDDLVPYANDCIMPEKTYIPDDKFEQKLINLGYDYALDDSVLTEDIILVSYLNLNHCGAVDLTGLENFTSLDTLKCQTYSITNLDLSKNKALQYLDCSSNQLTELDISKNIALLYLNCSQNQITTIDVSNNPKLVEFNCSGNELTSLSTNKNPALEKLMCGYNQITNIDVSINEALSFLTCYYNQLTTIDVTHCTELTYFDIRDNQLTELDVKNSTQLASFIFANNQLSAIDITHNVALELFGCNNNPLTSLDLSQNTAIESLYCSYTQITDLDLSNNTALTEIYCTYNKFKKLDLSHNTLLTDVDCRKNPLTQLNVKNGNNNLIWNFKATFNPDLNCIQVDNESKANSGMAPYVTWRWFKDETATYSENCIYTTLIADANFEQALIDLGIISDATVDGSVLTSELSSVTKLDVSDQNISDLSGIADFTALDTLIVNNNQITSLDLSSNANLIFLNLSNNPVSTLLLTSSDITKATTLTGEINITNENLLSIDISHTDIASIDISNIPNLETFIALSSNLESLDVSNNANLSNMDLRSCPLTCIQVSQSQLDNIPSGWQKEDAASYCNTTTDIDDNSVSEKITLHPNPVSGILYVESALQITKIEFYSVTGEIVKVVTSNFNTVNLSVLQKGLYIARIFTNNRVTVKKLIKD